MIAEEEFETAPQQGTPMKNNPKVFASREEAQCAMAEALSDLLKHHRYKFSRWDEDDEELPKPNLVMYVTPVDLLEKVAEISDRLTAAGFCESAVGYCEGAKRLDIIASFQSDEELASSTEDDSERGGKSSGAVLQEGASWGGDVEIDALKIALGDYLETKDGQKAMAFFKDFSKHFNRRFSTTAFREFVERNFDYPAYEEGFGIPDDEFPFDFHDAPKCRSFDEFYELCDGTFEDPDMWADARFYQSFMPQLSALLYPICPEYAFPYLLPLHFFKVKEIFRRLGIRLPKMPSRNDHEGRCRYLLDLFVAVYEFRTGNGFSPEEMCCLLYGYAPRFLVSYVKTEPVPANRVCIVGATKEDAESDLLRNPQDGDVVYWQGNAEMTPGDIVLVYETSPYCRIGSIWRAVSPGFDDPFHYFSGKVIVGHPMKIPHIGFSELAANPVWGRKGLVKGHMIGVSGQSCSVEEYEALKEMIHRKDPDFPLETLPMPPEYAQFFHENIKIERDVETQLLEPLLKKLGFVPADWVRQLELRMGRGDRVFPDYALCVAGDKNNRSAKFVWEAKYRIPSERQLEVDFGQAKSYALRLQSKALGLVALEGVWVAGADSGFNFRKLLHYTWKELENPANLSKLGLLFRKE